MKVSWNGRQAALVLRTCLIVSASSAGSLFAAQAPVTTDNPTTTFKEYCVGCHNKAAAKGGINLEQLTAQRSLGENFQQWQKVVAVLEEKRMPPAKLPQPSDAKRGEAISWIRTNLDSYIQKHAGDPGAVTMRRLTGGEYAYTIKDLTGLDLKFDQDFASDSVGGEGFTNFGDVQFMQDANLERYLEAAKRVANHAVIGAGSLGFYIDPGKSGFELSAINRIQDIYTTHGFRSAAGEGGKPYGLEKYSKAFYAAWRFQHRQTLGEPNVTLDQLAAEEGLSAKFTRHIWSVVQQPNPSYPTDQIVSLWRKLPAPDGKTTEQTKAKVRADCEEIQKELINWPRFLFAAGSLAAGGAGDERALVISDTTLQANSSHKLRFFARGRKQKTARIILTAVSVNPAAKDKPIVIWKNAGFRTRRFERGPAAGQTQPPAATANSAQRPLPNTPLQPLRSALDEATIAKLRFGKLPDGTEIGLDDFATVGDDPVVLDIPVPEETGGLEFNVEATMGPGEAQDTVARLTITGAEEVRGRPTWALLGNPKSPGYQAWKNRVFEFASNLPQVSHGEPTPSDNDPIPAPFNNAYNQPERDYYHYKVKYYRTDSFLTEKMLDDATRMKLEQAWSDLMASFEYHDARIRFVAEKYNVDLKKKNVADLNEIDLEAMPEEARNYIRPLLAEYKKNVEVQRAARSRHVEDCLQFAAKAWRRPLTEAEKNRLRAFYASLRKGPEVSHEKAVESLLTRVLVAPAFLYRLEQPAKVSGTRALSNWEMASRLSYFLWSSAPDDELWRAAGAGELSKPDQLERQVKRMLSDPKARRFATEFFGQWLGFYRFDQFRGVDTGRFPEFTDEVKSAMYDEAVSFFEHIVRKDKPVRELFFADYTFVNADLAKHYGLKQEIKSDKPVLVEGANAFQRGGMLRLGAVLATTSAPLRTSPVKRGDWVLRRVLGTPTPPPPPDAGSIPADEKAFGGLTLFEKLAAHQRNPTCAGCHSRIDPMGFPLERYDAVGRWRENYSDGKPIHDSSALADKTPISGVDGLLTYLKSQERQVMKNLSNKLLGYALGRTVLASDQPLVEELTKAGTDVTFSKLVTEVVTSKQFRYRRERNESQPSSPQTPHPQTAAQPSKNNPVRLNADNKVGGL